MHFVSAFPSTNHYHQFNNLILSQLHPFVVLDVSLPNHPRCLLRTSWIYFDCAAYCYCCLCYDIRCWEIKTNQNMFWTKRLNPCIASVVGLYIRYLYNNAITLLDNPLLIHALYCTAFFKFNTMWYCVCNKNALSYKLYNSFRILHWFFKLGE